MTCIIGFVNKGTVWLAGDSIASDLYNYTLCREPKVFQKGQMIFGFTDSFRMGQLIQHSLVLPRHEAGVDDIAYLTSTFVDAVIACFKTKEHAHVENAVTTGGSFLVGYRGKLYEVVGDFSVQAATATYETVGAGWEYAKGAMHILTVAKPPSRIKLYHDPKLILAKALEAAAAHSCQVKPPWSFVSLSGIKRNE